MKLHDSRPAALGSTLAAPSLRRDGAEEALDEHSGLAGFDRLVLASNRLPITLDEEPDGALRVHRAGGGLATGLSSLHRELDCRWIGWPGWTGPEALLPDEVTAQLEAEGFGGLALSEEEYDRFYLNTCNRCIWPLLHGFIERVQFDWTDWEVYRRVNERFAAAVIAELRPRDLVFVQDFHLMLVPELIRSARPQARVGFFLHVPFPHNELFRALPSREEVLRGVLGADVIGFHTLEYLRSFRSAARKVLGANTTTHAIEHEGRQVALKALPLGVDAAAWSRPDSDRRVAAELEDLRRAAAGRRVVLGVERLDYTKGIPQRLEAYRELLAANPDLAEEVVFFQVAVPSRVDVAEYRALKDEVEQLAGEINGRFGRVGLQPLHYQFHGVDQVRLTALYRIADVCMVTPLRDGLNLVAKEFVAARRDDTGVLVLSEFTGAVWELTEALKVNPYDIKGMSRTLERALAMDSAEQAGRMGPMRARVHRDDVHRWTRACLKAIACVGKAPDPVVLDENVRAEVGARFLAASRRIIALDWDGTLRELERTPEAATPTPEILELIHRLGAAKGVEAWIASGRDSSFLARHLDIPTVGLLAEHGAFARPPGEEEFRRLLPLPSPGWKDLVRPILSDASGRVPGSIVEDKPLGMAWHYRAAEPDSADWQAQELYLHLGEVLADEPLEVMHGSKVLEVRPAGVSKARGLAHMLRERWDEEFSTLPSELLIVAGDDVTDEDLFRGFPGAVSILVGERPSAAAYRLPRPVDLRNLLLHLLELIEPVHPAR